MPSFGWFVSPSPRVDLRPQVFNSEVLMHAYVQDRVFLLVLTRTNRVEEKQTTR